MLAALVLAIAFGGVQSCRLNKQVKATKAAVSKLQGEREAHKLTLASIKTCLASLDRQNDAIDALGKSSAKTIKASQMVVDARSDARGGVDRVVTVLRAPVGSGGPQCATPDIVKGSGL